MGFGAALGGAGVAAGGNSLSQLWGWVSGNMALDRQKSAIRHLRRREYLDMMFSMRQAGLNPMLASGATPGHSAVSAPDYGNTGGLGNDMAAGAATALEADRQGSVIKKMAAEEGLARDKAWSERFYREAAERGLAYQLDNMKLSNIASAMNTDKIIAETDEAIARTQSHWADVAKTGVSAKEIAARAKAAELENVGKENEANFRRTPLGRTLQEIGIGLGDASKIIGPVGGFLLGRGTKGPTMQRVPATATRATQPYYPSSGSYSTGKRP